MPFDGQTNPASPTERPFAHRTAFVLNANARAVTDRVVEQLGEVVPAGDLFLSRSLEDAAVFCRTIAQRGYGQVFTGGGDGTLLDTVNRLRDETAKRHQPMPKVGVLKLGTGNAVGGLLGAQRPSRDAFHIVHGGESKVRAIPLVKDQAGTLAPFAGVGYDGEVLNDYIRFKTGARTRFVRWLAGTVFGYLLAMLFVTVPRKLRARSPRILVKSNGPAWKVVQQDGRDTFVEVAPGSVLFEGNAACAAVGSVPYFGFGFTMFPFALTKDGTAQLRIVTSSIPKILANLWPSVWKGHWRDEGIFDFLVTDIVIEAERPIDYQVGGDAAGAQERLHFTVDARPVEMLTLGDRLKPQRARGVRGLLQPKHS